MKKNIISFLIIMTSIFSGFAQDQEFYGTIKADSISNGVAIDTFVTQDATGYLNKTKYSEVFAKIKSDLESGGMGTETDPSFNAWLSTGEIADGFDGLNSGYFFNFNSIGTYSASVGELFIAENSLNQTDFTSITMQMPNASSPNANRNMSIYANASDPFFYWDTADLFPLKMVGDFRLSKSVAEINSANDSTLVNKLWVEDYVANNGGTGANIYDEFLISPSIDWDDTQGKLGFLNGFQITFQDGGFGAGTTFVSPQPIEYIAPQHNFHNNIFHGIDSPSENFSIGHPFINADFRVDTAGVSMPDSTPAKIDLKGAKAVPSVEWVQQYVVGGAVTVDNANKLGGLEDFWYWKLKEDVILGESVTVGQVIKQGNDGKYYVADKDDAIIGRLLYARQTGVLNGTIEAQNTAGIDCGSCTDDVGTPVYLSDNGAVTTTKPTTGAVKRIGFVAFDENNWYTGDRYYWFFPHSEIEGVTQGSETAIALDTIKDTFNYTFTEADNGKILSFDSGDPWDGIYCTLDATNFPIGWSVMVNNVAGTYASSFAYNANNHFVGTDGIEENNALPYFNHGFTTYTLIDTLGTQRYFLAERHEAEVTTTSLSNTLQSYIHKSEMYNSSSTNLSNSDYKPNELSTSGKHIIFNYKSNDTYGVDLSETTYQIDDGTWWTMFNDSGRDVTFHNTGGFTGREIAGHGFFPYILKDGESVKITKGYTNEWFFDKYQESDLHYLNNLVRRVRNGTALKTGWSQANTFLFQSNTTGGMIITSNNGTQVEAGVTYKVKVVVDQTSNSFPVRIGDGAYSSNINSAGTYFFDLTTTTTSSVLFEIPSSYHAYTKINHIEIMSSKPNNLELAYANEIPASASASGVKGQIIYGTDYIYICIDTDTWKRAPLSTW